MFEFCRYNDMVQSRVRPLHQKVIQTRTRIVDVKEKIVTMEDKLKVTFPLV